MRVWEWFSTFVFKNGQISNIRKEPVEQILYKCLAAAFLLSSFCLLFLLSDDGPALLIFFSNVRLGRRLDVFPVLARSAVGSRLPFFWSLRLAGRTRVLFFYRSCFLAGRLVRTAVCVRTVRVPGPCSIGRSARPRSFLTLIFMYIIIFFNRKENTGFALIFL